MIAASHVATEPKYVVNVNEEILNSISLLSTEMLTATYGQ